MPKRLLLFLLLCSHRVSGQSEPYLNILNDPDVIWAAEMDLQFAIDPEALDSNRHWLRGQNSAAALPGFPPVPDSVGVSFPEQLLDLCMNGRALAFNPFWKTRRMDAAFRRGSLRSPDTITVVDPETTMEYTRVVYNDPDPANITGLRVKQLLFYRASSGEFDLFTSAFAPVFEARTRDEFNVLLYTSTPYWFNLPPWSPKPVVLKKSDIAWARRMNTLGNTPAPDSLLAFKNFKPPILKQLLNRFQADPNYPVFDTENKQPLPFDQREGLITRVDTIITFDPETYEERSDVVRTELNGYESWQLYLSEDWYWDEKKQRLITRLHAFAPAVESSRWNGELLGRKVLFWKRKG